VSDNTLEELVKSMRELKVEMSALKKDHMPSNSQPSDGSKGVIVQCIYKLFFQKHAIISRKTRLSTTFS